MFPNLFNEWYPRQTNRKINAVIQHKAEKGADCFHSTLWLPERPHGHLKRRKRCGVSSACTLPAWGRSRLPQAKQSGQLKKKLPAK